MKVRNRVSASYSRIQNKNSLSSLNRLEEQVQSMNSMLYQKDMQLFQLSRQLDEALEKTDQAQNRLERLRNYSET